MAIFGKDYQVIAYLFSCLYRDQYLVHVASCTDKILRYLCYTFPLEHGKGPSLIIEEGRYWESRKGDKMNYVFREGEMTYTLEIFESLGNPGSFYVYLEIKDSNNLTTTWKMEDASGWPENDWGLPYVDEDQFL